MPRPSTNGKSPYRGNGDYAHAIQDYNQAIELNAENAVAFKNRCRSHAIARQFQAALADCTQSLILVPNDVEWLVNSGFVCLSLNNPDAEIADFNAALAINQKNGSFLYVRGMAGRMKGDKAAADADSAAAQAITPDIEDQFAKWRVTAPQP